MKLRQQLQKSLADAQLLIDEKKPTHASREILNAQYLNDQLFNNNLITQAERQAFENHINELINKLIPKTKDEFETFNKDDLEYYRNKYTFWQQTTTANASVESYKEEQTDDEVNNNNDNPPKKAPDCVIS